MSKRLTDFPVGTEVRVESGFIAGRKGQVGVVEEQLYYLNVRFADGQMIPFFTEELEPVD